ncbi:MAG: hypothetical protein U1E21_13740 [Reyranellaceae bacterium]
MSPALAADYFGGGALESIFGALYSGAILAGAVLYPIAFAITLTMWELREGLARRRQPR